MGKKRVGAETGDSLEDQWVVDSGPVVDEAPGAGAYHADDGAGKDGEAATSSTPTRTKKKGKGGIDYKMSKAKRKRKEMEANGETVDGDGGELVTDAGADGEAPAKRIKHVKKVKGPAKPQGEQLTKAQRRARNKEKLREKLSQRDQGRDANIAGSPSEVAAFYSEQIDAAFGKNLTSLEKAEYILDESRFTSPDGFASSGLRVPDQLEYFIQAIHEDWEELLKTPDAALAEKAATEAEPVPMKKSMRKKLKKQQADAELFNAAGERRQDKGAPVVVVLTSSGIQAANVIRSLKPFGELCRIGKCFAKHIKLEEQITWLNKTFVRVVVGTPNRILKLLDSGALRKGELQTVIIDASNKDQKQRGIFQIAEVRTELFNIIKTHVAAETKVKVALF